eukprot:TRINITY_DN71634_c0_g1_i1.p1 TRINITY_DN71634_c0_g1~~TRINITY_DN71634_c0_g1_i1.p1  ORF type:complete len:536 (+),score=148.79 TRINITY_DN71634_c0_g1_i1:83-1609(+)
MPAPSVRVFRGTLIDAPADGELRIRAGACIGVGPDGVIVFVRLSDGTWELAEGRTGWGEADAAAAVRAAERDGSWAADVPPPGFICPGFVDLHAHAPQSPYSGTGTDLPLMEWLQRYTFPAERSLAEQPGKALRVYGSAVARSLRHGTTTCVWWGTLHHAPSMVLARVCAAAGQRAFVAKVSMDRNGAPGYEESGAAAALQAAEHFVDAVRAECGTPGSGRPPPLVQPCVCPRFVPTCSDQLLAGLGELRRRKGPLLATTHVAESRDEVLLCSALAERHRGEARDAAVLKRCGLLAAPSVSAHAVHLSDAEMKDMAALGAGIAHCPLSNCYFADATLRTKEAAAMGVPIGLATDIAGGYDPTMLSAVRHSVTASRTLAHCPDSWVTEDAAAPAEAAVEERHKRHAIDWRTAFWLATAGGAAACGLGGIVGHLSPGMEFDALRISPGGGDRADIFPEDPPAAVFEKWLNLCDDRSIAAAWVRGAGVLPVGGAGEWPPPSALAPAAAARL